MKTKLWLFFVAFGLIFSACEKDAEFRGGPPPHAKAGAKGQISETLNTQCESKAETPLIAGQHHEVGKVRVEHDGVYIVVTYETNPGWLITETHLHITDEKDGFPTNRPGNPMIGHFMFGNDSEFRVVDGNKVIYTIPWDDGCWYIAAHAVVKGFGTLALDAFAELLPDDATIEVEWPVPANNPVSYFPNVKVTQADFLDGDYPGWCIQADASIWQEPYDNVIVYSSYEEVPGYSADFLMKLNWILNQNFVGQGFTYGEVQIAIWLLSHDEIDINNDWEKELEGYAGNPLNSKFIGSYDKANVVTILESAALVDNFVPERGGVIAIVLITPYSENRKREIQDLIIEYPLPYGEETAWGQGCRFVNRGNWAMYFMVCL